MSPPHRDFPAPDRSPEDLFAEWAARVESGDPQSIEPLLDAHPGQRPVLERLYEDWKLFAPILGKVVPGLMASDVGLGAAPVSRADDDDEPPSAELLDRLRIHTPNAGRYRFRAVIGRGGGGVVLKVWDSKLNRPLAMKVVLGRGEDGPTGDTPRVGSRTLARFVDEARIASQLNHPGIVPVHELGADETGRAFFTMKLVRGEHLGVIFDHVKTGHDGWNLTRALGVLLRVCEAMSYAHDKAVIHRDLKPANVMVGRYGEVYVMDWGLARVIGGADAHIPALPLADMASQVDSIRARDRESTPNSPLKTLDGAVMGTPMYMAPEQARNETRAIDQRSDVYAVGAMLYELVAGQAPYSTPGANLSAWAIYRMLLDGPPQSVALLARRSPAELVAICEKAMSRELLERYPSIHVLAADLRAFLERRVVRAYESGAWAEARKWIVRNRALAASLAATMLLLAAGLLALSTKNKALDAALSDSKIHADIATWRSWIATARETFPDDPEMRAMLVREVPATLRDGYSERRSIEAVAGDYSRVCALLGHEGGVTAIAWSPDGTCMATASKDQTARVWNANGTGAPVLLRGHEGTVTSVRWSPNGRRLVTAAEDGTARVWNVPELDRVLVLRDGDEGVRTAEWSPDGHYIATASENGAVRVWNAGEGTLTRTLLVHTDAVNTAMWSPDGKRLVTASDDGTARVWAPDDSGDGLLLSGHAGAVTKAVWSPDGRRVATSSSDRTVRLWDTTKPSTPLVLQCDDEVVAVAWSPDGTRIISVDESRATNWNADGSGEAVVLPEQQVSIPRPSPLRHGVQFGAPHFQVNSRYRLRSAQWSPDGALVALASDDNAAHLYRADGFGGATLFQGHEDDVRCVEWSHDGSHIATGSEDGTIRVWRESATGEPFMSPDWPKCEGQPVWSPDGTRIAVKTERGIEVLNAIGRGLPLVLEGSTTGMVTWSRDSSRIGVATGDSAQVWSANGVREVGITPDQTLLASKGQWNPDLHSVVFTSFDCTARVYDVDPTIAPVALGEPANGGSGFFWASWSPDGTRLVTQGDVRDEAQVWRADGRADPVVLSVHGATVASAEWSPDGSRVVTACNDGKARVWRADGLGAPVIVQSEAGMLWNAEWNAAGDRIATVSEDQGLRVCNADGTGMPVVLYTGGDINRIAWNPDGSRLLAVLTGEDRWEVRVWEADGTGEIRLRAGTFPVVTVEAASWSPEGERIATINGLGQLCVWTVGWPALRARLWQTIDDILSPRERVRFLGEDEAEANANYARQKAERDARIAGR